jgi:hypothetical protein
MFEEIFWFDGVELTKSGFGRISWGQHMIVTGNSF